MAISEIEKKLYDLIQLRLKDAKSTMNQLQPLVARWSRQASWVRGLLILFGSLVATASFAEDALSTFSSKPVDMMITKIAYTICGVLITFLAGLEAAFKIPEKASGLRTLHADAGACVREYMAGPYLIEESDEAAKIAALRTFVTKQNQELTALQRKAANLGVELRIDEVDYTDSLSKAMLGDGAK